MLKVTLVNHDGSSRSVNIDSQRVSIITTRGLHQAIMDGVEAWKESGEAANYKPRIMVMSDSTPPESIMIDTDKVIEVCFEVLP